MPTEPQSDIDILVFGAGQMRTGTMSLKVALEYLYNGKCYHMIEVLRNKGHLPVWQKCVERRGLIREDANKVFKGYIASVDHPASVFYRDLMALYPNAKVILTVRDPDSWVRSVRETTMKNYYSNVIFNVIFYLSGFNKFIEFAHSLVTLTFQRSYEELRRDDELLKACFIKFNEVVKNTVPKDRLLVFEAKEGWEPLCNFLGKDVPEIPYPKINSTEDFRVNIKKRSTLLGITVFVPFSIVVLMASFGLFRLRNLVL